MMLSTTSRQKQIPSSPCMSQLFNSKKLTLLLALAFVLVGSQLSEAALLIEIDKSSETWRISGDLNVTGLATSGSASFDAGHAFNFSASGNSILRYSGTAAWNVDKYAVSGTDWINGSTNSGYQGSSADINSLNPNFQFAPAFGIYLPSGVDVFSWTSNTFTTPSMHPSLLATIPDGTFSNVYTLVEDNTQTITVQNFSASAVAVPEPSSVGLLVIGAMGLMLRRKRS